MTNPTLPPDIAEAIDDLIECASRIGYNEGPITVGRAGAEACCAALEAVILGHLPVWRPIESVPKDGTAFLAYWLRRNTDGTRYEAAQPYVVARYERGRLFPSWIGDDTPTHWMPLPSPPATDLGRAALAEEGRGE